MDISLSDVSSFSSSSSYSSVSSSHPSASTFNYCGSVSQPPHSQATDTRFASPVHKTITGFTSPVHKTITGVTSPVHRTDTGITSPAHRRDTGITSPVHRTDTGITSPMYKSGSADTSYSSATNSSNYCINPHVQNAHSAVTNYSLASEITSPIHKAATEGNGDQLRRILQCEADVNLPLKDGTAPLFCAANNGHAG